jgi:hypothetical protein
MWKSEASNSISYHKEIGWRREQMISARKRIKRPYHHAIGLRLDKFEELIRFDYIKTWWTFARKEEIWYLL